MNLHFAIDILDILSVWSLKLQKSSDLLFDKLRQRDEVLEQLNEMKYPHPRGTDGTELKQFKEDLRCWGQTPLWIQWKNGIPQVVHTYAKTKGSKCDENEFDTATYAEWRGFPLLPRTVGADNLCYLDIDEEYSPKLSDVRAGVINRLMEQIREYFPHQNLLQALRVLDPKEIPRDVTEHSAYWSATKDDIGTIARILTLGDVQGPLSQHDQLHLDVLQNEWKQLLSQFSLDPEFPKHTELSPADFWKIYLSKAQAKLAHLLEICVSLPSGSVSVESGFSVLGKIISKEKTSQQLPATNAQMFTRLNGPKPKNFKPRKMATHWIEVLGRVRADDPLNGREPEEEDEIEGTLLGDSLFA